MKVFAISDLHLSVNNPKPMDIFGPVWDGYIDQIIKSWRAKAGENDVVAIAGDISWAMTLENAAADLNLLAELPGKKIIIRGNHDYWWKSVSALRKLLPENFYALQNDSVRIGDVLFCGSRGWSTEAGTPEDKKIFNRELIRLRLSLEAMRKTKKDGDKIIVLIHYPPFNFKLEDSDFTRLFSEFDVDKVLYGHLHGKSVRCVPRLVKGNTEYIMTSCDQVNNSLVEIL